jgi:hypothetical protein
VLTGVAWSGKNLAFADLASANLRNANLRNANLEHAVLAGADLRGADLNGARLGGATLAGANVTGAKLDALFVATRMPNGTINSTGSTIAVTPAVSAVANGQTRQFTAIGRYRNGATVTLRTNVTWSSLQPQVATVTADGLATGVVPNNPFKLANFPRSATIRAAAGGAAGSAALVVGPPVPTAAAVTPGTAALLVAATQQFAATVTFSDSSTLSTSSFPGLTWSSSAPAVATVNGNGLATAVAPGAATITAALGSLSRSASLTVTPSLAITTTTLPAGTVGSPYSATLTSTDPAGAETWTITAGALPAGLTLSPDGVITGTPAAAGTSAITARVDNPGPPAQFAERELSIVVRAPLAIATDTLPSGTTGAVYSESLTATGGVAPHTWTITSGALPSGLMLNAASGVIAGTPAAAGTSTFTVEVTDSQDPPAVASRELSITVSTPSTPLLPIFTSIGVVVRGNPFNPYRPLTAGGGVQPFTWSLTDGALPDGLALDPATGLISGTPTRTGLFGFTVRLTDAVGQFVTRVTSIDVVRGLAIGTEGPLPQGTEGVQFGCGLNNPCYSTRLYADGDSPPPFVWSLAAGNLPPGLQLNDTTGVISGDPTVAGTYTFTVRLSNFNVAYEPYPERQFSITIRPPGPHLRPALLPDARFEQPYAFGPLDVIGGTGPLQWSISAGSLPAGLSLDPVTGVISGSPTGVTSSFTVQALDAGGTAAFAEQSIRVLVPLSVVAQVPFAVVGSPYLATLKARGGAGPYLWSIVSGSLPSGFAMDVSGRISGGGPNITPGAYTFTVRVTDTTFPLAQSDTRQVTLNVVPNFGGGRIVVSPDLPPGVQFTDYTWLPTATGGQAPYSWAIDGLPAGFTVNPATGELRGSTNNVVGTFPIVVRVSDTSGNALWMYTNIVISHSFCILCGLF